MANADSGKRDIRQELTDRLVAKLEEGTMPWRRSWKVNGTLAMGSPKNALTGKTYRGGNTLTLLMEAQDRGYADSRWLTFRQSTELGGAVRKGEKGTWLEYWEKQEFWKRKDVLLRGPGGRTVFVDRSRPIEFGMVPIKGAGQILHNALVVEHAGKQMSWRQADLELSRLAGKSFVVFNVAQCDGMSIENLPTQVESAYGTLSRIVEGMKNDGLSIRHGGERAFYSPSIDTVTMPPQDKFDSVDSYQGTLLHELGHATGHANRTNRVGVSGMRTEETYAREELVAELTSVFMAAETGIAFDDVNHAAYIGSWLEALKKDKNEIYRAAKEAGQASDYMIDHAIESEITIERDQEPEPESLESSLRNTWSEQGVSKERQDELIAAIAAKARPGAMVGPFAIQFEAPEQELER